ncbi:MAG: SurA N-terminal domain-containing protein [Alphaproteobacteria bacterium]|nr:SurA N-terminal domain-containing protein [Alphaproteobacteria bacterium]
MLQAIRTRAGGIIVKVLFGLLILSFGFWGIYTRSPFFQDKNSPDTVVASVGDRDIRADAVQAALEPALERLRAQLGGNIDPAQVKQLGVLDAIVDQMIDRSLLDQEVAHLRLDLSDDVVRGAITSNPAFVGPDGKFNRAQFNQVLQMNRLTEDGLVARLRQEIPRGDLLQALTAGVRVPRPVIDVVYRYRNETRVADIVAVPLSAAGAVAAPSEDALNKFYEAHPDMFRAAEYRGFTVATLTADAVSGDLKVSDDQLKTAYEERKNDFDLPEQRQVQQILAPSEDKAKAAETALAGGQDFQTVASTIAGQDPSTTDLGMVKQDDLPKELAEPAFSLPLNKPSEPIKTQLGWHILRVVKIEPPHTPSFDQAKEQLTKDLVHEAAAERLERIGTEADDALAGGASLADVAKKYGLTLTTIDNTDIGGRDLDGKPIVLPVDMKAVLKAAFDANENETSRVTGIEDGAIFAVHVDKVIAPRVKPLPEVKERVAAAWQAEQKKEAVKKTADAVAAAVSGGTPLAKAAGDQKLTMTTTPPLARRPDASAPVPAAVVVKLFAAKTGDIVTADDAAGAYVAQLKEIKVPDTVPDDQAKALSSELGNAARYDMVGELTAALKKRFPVTVHRDALDKML